MNKTILEVVHDSAKGLHRTGVVDDVTMREFDILCLPHVEAYTPAQIKRIREKTRTSQGVFAAYLNTSKFTVQKWEQGTKKPNGPSLKLLNIVERKGLGVLV